MSFVFHIPAFSPDSRGNKITASAITTDARSHWLYLCGPEAAIEQIEDIAWPGCRRVEVPSESSGDYNFCLEFGGDIPADVLNLVLLLSNAVTLPRLDGIDLAIALDFYKDPNSHENPMQWSNTVMGELNRRSKYFSAGSLRRDARVALLGKMADFIRSHPAYSAADVIVAAPGHLGDGKSFGELLARAVARELGLPYVQADNRNGPREQQKEGIRLDEGAFVMREGVGGRVLLIDDVFRSGATMIEIGRAARAAGADEVYGLTAVRTMRR